MGSRMAYPLHPRHLGLEFSLPINIDDLELLHKGQETAGGQAGKTRGLGDIHENTGEGFEVLCCRFSDVVVLQGS